MQAAKITAVQKSPKSNGDTMQMKMTGAIAGADKQTMANKMPRSMMDFLQVSGVGEVKASRYGKAFLRAIEEYLEG